MSLPDEQRDRCVATALAAADAAREITAKYFRAALPVASKDDRTPVTVADTETEQRLKELILARHPRHSFLGEESGATDNEPEWRWVIDPIDGTKSFATGNPAFGTLIALLHHDCPLIGVIDHPALNERWLGVAGKPTTHNGAPCATSEVRRLADASIYATTPDLFTRTSLAQFNRLSQSFQFRVFGGDCYCYGLLARGFTEAVCEARMNPHDYMALIPVVEGAGGVITDWQGNPLTLRSTGEVLATANPELHRAALGELDDARHSRTIDK